MKKTILLFAGLFLISSSLYAAPYVFVEGGYSAMPAGQGGSQTFTLLLDNNVLNTVSESFSSNETNSTPLLSAGMGWEQRFNNNFLSDNRIEVAYNQLLPTKTQGTRSETINNGDTSFYNYSYQVTSSQLYVNDIIEFGAMLPKIHPFIGGGFGLGLNTTNDYSENNIGQNGIFSEKSGLDFLYTLTTGFSIHTNTPWTFFVGYRYIHAGNASTSSYNPPDIIVNSNTTSDIALVTPMNINEVYIKMSYQL